TQLDQIRTENEDRRTKLLEETRAGAALASEIGTLEAQLARADESRLNSRSLQTELDAQFRDAGAAVADLDERQHELSEQLTARAAALAAAQAELAEERRRQAQRQKELAKTRERHTATAERSRLLSELENRLEGVSAGVKEVLGLAKADIAGPFRHVRGMLADLMQVDVKYARLIELALGEKAQYLVISPAEPVFHFLAAERRSLQGRVGFLPLDTGAADGERARGADLPRLSGNLEELSQLAAATDLSGCPGVIARADQFVQSAAEYEPLVRRLLNHTWIVESFERCLSLAKVAPTYQFISLTGEMLSKDSVLTVGPLQVSVGLISRRSELRSLVQQISDFQRSIQDLEALLARLESELAEKDSRVVELTGEHQRAAEMLAEERMRLLAAQQQHARLEQQLSTATAAAQSAEHAWKTTSESLADARGRLAERQASLSDAEVRIRNNARRVAELDEQRQARNRETMAAKVELARSEQQLEHLEAQLRQFERDREERQRAIADGQEHLAQSITRIRDVEEQILSSESE
ncbi:MAG TPA: hypothetical protein VKB78_16790, partial [Pirellulales bacterium]|nr:hypothetical protein [Pirellulales bacterium]